MVVLFDCFFRLDELCLFFDAMTFGCSVDIDIGVDVVVVSDADVLSGDFFVVVSIGCCGDGDDIVLLVRSTKDDQSWDRSGWWPTPTASSYDKYDCLEQ